MKDCQLCGEGRSEYPVELMTDGIIQRMLVCQNCKDMVKFRKEI